MSTKCVLIAMILVVGASAMAQNKQANNRMSVPSTDYVYQYTPPQPRQQVMEREPQARASVQTSYTAMDAQPTQRQDDSVGYRYGMPSTEGAETDYTSDQRQQVAPVQARPIRTEVYGSGYAAAAPRALPVHLGRMPCELGASVTVLSGHVPGTYQLQFEGQAFVMRQVPATTGVVRLEDDARQLVWVQLANKSMLLDQVAGKRLVDDCAGQEQVAQAAYMSRMPQQNLLTGRVD